ncbi:hypothetical protein J2Z50_003413 [Ensifer mexicanus]|nr:hypothetical protein [Sinorhizobium mexicanum]
MQSLTLLIAIAGCNRECRTYGPPGQCGEFLIIDESFEEVVPFVSGAASMGKDLLQLFNSVAGKRGYCLVRPGYDSVLLACAILKLLQEHKPNPFGLCFLRLYSEQNDADLTYACCSNWVGQPLPSRP